MPNYDYYCDENGKTIEVNHGIDQKLHTWGELCFAAQISLGDTDFSAPVRKLIRPVGIAVPTSNSKLKEHGFTKLVKRDDGVYENVTALDGESRYMKAGDDASIPHLNKKISS
ncbi:MAG: zinc ribbon domain-containing protein [Pseudomonadota bacterium]